MEPVIDPAVFDMPDVTMCTVPDCGQVFRHPSMKRHMIAQHGVLADGRQATADQVLAARRRPGTHTTQPTGTVTGGQSAALGTDGAMSEPVTPTEPAVNPAQEPENPAPPTTTASEGAVVAPRKDLQRLVGVRHASATVNWRERVCLPPGVCQQMLEWRRCRHLRLVRSPMRRVIAIT